MQKDRMIESNTACSSRTLNGDQPIPQQSTEPQSPYPYQLKPQTPVWGLTTWQTKYWPIRGASLHLGPEFLDQLVEGDVEAIAVRNSYVFSFPVRKIKSLADYSRSPVLKTKDNREPQT